jgi:hypothetical protein
MEVYFSLILPYSSGKHLCNCRTGTLSHSKHDDVDGDTKESLVHNENVQYGFIVTYQEYQISGSQKFKFFYVTVFLIFDRLM